VTVENRFNEGFPSDGLDWMASADLLHKPHLLFHQSDTAIDPSVHGIFSVEKIISAWKELLKEYDTVMVNFTKSGYHDSSFTKAAMMVRKKSGVTWTPVFRLSLCLH
jgi:hypothetical protein